MTDAVLFDLDGTLVATHHDYPAWKRLLGLPPDRGVLEGLSGLAPEARAAALVRIAALELDLARRATPHDGARRVVTALVAGGTRVGIVTRNTRANALVALAAAGLDGLFATLDIVGRDEAEPKPSPAGLALLLDRLGVPAARAWMVGDGRADLEAARAAGVVAVGYDPRRTGSLADHSDRVIYALDELAW